MIISSWNHGADWWFVPSIFVKRTSQIFEIGFVFLKFKIEYVKINE